MIDALNAVPRLDRQQVRLLPANAAVPLEYERNGLENVRGARQARAERQRAYEAARHDLIAAARHVLNMNEPEGGQAHSRPGLTSWCVIAGEASCLAGGMIRLWRSWSIERC
ncbi:hypothetical protein [Streptomyces sp. NRRL S-1022]|uniref:hypothetical protein n=1 Tax=Streptomyces sp. NRRL S-1022 TaxID=1463880 RepID=UPI00131C4A81|nr:hypothetical protein [Streptomyces sp. NRRL S-1022]